MASPDEYVRHAAGYELGYAGAAAQDVLVHHLHHEHVAVRRIASFALGETRSESASSVRALVACLDDTDGLVRSNAAFSIGSLARVQTLEATTVDSLLDRLDARIEPDNLDNAALPRSTVRECVAGALLNAAANGQLGEAHRVRLADIGLRDSDRYVRGLTVQALRLCAATSTPDWVQHLVGYLTERQFVPPPAAVSVPLAPEGFWNSRSR